MPRMGIRIVSVADFQTSSALLEYGRPDLHCRADDRYGRGVEQSSATPRHSLGHREPGIVPVQKTP